MAKLSTMAVGVLIVLLFGITVASGQEMTRSGVGMEAFTPTGPPSLVEAQDPMLRKQYFPQSLYAFYRWEGWEYSNYAREHFRRYVSVQLEGENYYDLYGNYITRGWRVYEWKQDQPTSFGSSIYKDNRLMGWFNSLLIASDSKGQSHTALTIGESIRSTLTPLTFMKPILNGIQWDFLSDKYALTLIGSRISAPMVAAGQSYQVKATNYTNFLGSRGTIQIGGFLEMGFTYVNSSTGVSRLDWSDSSLKGNLGISQNAGTVREIIISISDDSPNDGEAGGRLYSEQIYINGEAADIKPDIEGGILRRGVLNADGQETIKLRYEIPDPEEVEKIGFDLVLSNDYYVEVTSNLQTNASNQPVFLPVAWASGNIKDNSNQRVVHFDYGLPTGNDIYGFTVDIEDLKGFNIRGEFDVNRRFRRFPNINLKKHALSTNQSKAYFLNLSKVASPWYAYGEFFQIDDDYSTSVFMVNNAGFVDYEDKEFYMYEYVDDNDDQDRYPDWRRANQGMSDGAVIPGLDENNDFVSDFNQNRNLKPDYAEPFLRYNVDPPEFLFGVDMNHNTVIDWFENDEEPDYPYKRNHRGYNVYLRGEVLPDVKLTLGYLSERLLSDDRRNKSVYSMLTVKKDHPKLGVLRVFDDFRIVKDNIIDNLIQWKQESGTIGAMERFNDPLLAQNTVINTFFLGYDYTRLSHLNVFNKVKYEIYHQRSSAPVGIGDVRFWGMINKADYTLRFGELTIRPKFKSMYRNIDRELGEDTDEWTQTLLLVLKHPILGSSWLEGGIEYTMFFNRMPIPTPVPTSYVDDFRNTVFSLEFTNRIAFMGYGLITNVGFQVERKRFETLTENDVTIGSAFITAYASVGE